VPLHDAVRALCEANRRSLFLDAGGFDANGVRAVPCFFQAMAQEGLQGGKGDTHEVAQPQHIHDPGIQQELSPLSHYFNTSEGLLQLAISSICSL
jgi:hypothetical protein